MRAACRTPFPFNRCQELNRNRIHFLFLNIGHFFDHLFILIFATAAALTLAREWGMSYAALIPYATPGFIAFALFLGCDFSSWQVTTRFVGRWVMRTAESVVLTD